MKSQEPVYGEAFYADTADLPPPKLSLDMRARLIADARPANGAFTKVSEIREAIFKEALKHLREVTAHD